jgi:two-component system, NtrC family, nitrogen regulation sensor histidine kinase NtrY
MSEARGRWLPVSVAVALGLVVLLQVQQLAGTLRWQARMRGRLVNSIEGPLRALKPELERSVSYGITAWPDALGLVRRLHPAAEVELLDRGGASLAAQPAASPVRHALDERERDAMQRGEMLTVGPVGRAEQARVLTYMPLRAGAHEVLLRVSQPAPELVQDVVEHRQLAVVHVLVLLALALSAILFLVASRTPVMQPPAGLEAYAEAMTRLRDHGQDQSAQHLAVKRQLEDRIRDAEPMTRAGELTTGIVHEVRNGLGTIVGYARLAEQSDDTAARDAARHIRAECDTLEVVVRRFVEFVKADRLVLERLDLRRMLSRVAARESSGVSGAPVTILPGEDVTVVGDEALLERAFENLVRNAREAAGSGGEVTVAVRGEPAHAVVSVLDDGPGLSSSDRDALRPFRTTKPGGLGLGLPLAFKIVHLHDGDIVMGPRSPRGLAVTVRLPVNGPEPAAERPGPRLD